MNVAIFWSLAGLMMALAMAVLVLPLLRSRTLAATDSRRLTNASIYRDQLEELERDRQSGSIAQADYEVSRVEIERRLLEDASLPARPSTAAHGGTRLAVAAMVAIPLLAVPLYLTLGKPAAIDASHAATAAGGMPSMADLDKLAAGLAVKLEQNPDNPTGWVMLGRTYKLLGRFDEAEQAFQRAGAAANALPELMLERVELAAQRNDGRIEGEALKLLDRVLKESPDNLTAVYLAGLGAFNRNDYRGAITRWERLLTKIPPDSEDARNLSAGIAEARARLGTGNPATTGSRGGSAAPAYVKGRVQLAAGLTAKAAAGDTVFVFAKAAQGPRMPLAVLKAKVADLPLDFTLDDSMAMSPDARLSTFKTVRLEARISKSGNAIGQAGDLVGSIENVAVGASGQILTIDRTLP